MVVNCKNIEVSYGDHKVLNRLNFSVNKGDKVVITGESGKGKTTLMNVLAGFIPISDGKIEMLGEELNAKNISEIRSKIAWVPQETSLQFDSVLEMIYAPFDFRINRDNRPKEAQIKSLFVEFGLPFDLLKKSPSTISGGQRQRILLVSSLLLNKPLLLIDEPTSALDEGNKERITDYIISRKDLTVIASTHDNYWIEHSDKVIAL